MPSLSPRQDSSAVPTAAAKALPSAIDIPLVAAVRELLPDEEGSVFMRIIVIGKEGQVARSLAERARAHGAQAVLVGRPKLDLADPSGIEDALIETGGDVIVNAAAYTAVDQAEAAPELAEAINGIGAGVVAGTAAAMNVPLIHLSTDYVFDGTADHPYREDDPVSP